MHRIPQEEIPIYVITELVYTDRDREEQRGYIAQHGRVPHEQIMRRYWSALAEFGIFKPEPAPF